MPVKQMSDLRPTTPTYIHKTQPILKQPVSATQPVAVAGNVRPDHSPLPQPKTPTPIKSRDSLWTAIKTGRIRANTWKFLQYGLIAAVITTLPIIVSSRLYPSELNFATLPLKIIIAVIAYRIIIYLLTNLLGNTVIYGSAKVTDNRTVNSRNWRSAAIGSLWSTVGLDLAIIAMAVVVALTAIGLATIIRLLSLASFTQIVVWRVVLGLALYLVFSLVLIRQLARNAIVVGDLKIFNSIMLGIRLWRRHTAQIIGAALFSITTSLLAVAIYLAVIFGLKLSLDNFNHPPSVILPAIAIVLGWLFAGLLLVFNWSYWQAIYRLLVHLSASSEQSRYLSGRSSKETNQLSAGLLWLTIIGLLLVTGYSVWRTSNTAPLPITTSSFRQLPQP